MREKRILGLDISTTTIGWALMTPEGFSLEMHYIPLGKIENLYKKAQEFRKWVQLMHARWDITHVFIEEDLKKFRRGFSSATVIRKLSRFNGMACLVVFEELGLSPELVNVNKGRKSLGVVIDKKDKTKSTKEKVFDWLIENDEFCKNFDWPTKILRGGPRKGQEVMITECGDMADAYVMARSGLIDFAL
jgi:hypothetical protein